MALFFCNFLRKASNLDIQYCSGLIELTRPMGVLHPEKLVSEPRPVWCAKVKKPTVRMVDPFALGGIVISFFDKINLIKSNKK